MSTGGTIKVNGIKPEFLKVPILKISEMGGDFKMGKDWIRLKAPKSTKSVNIVTDPYPGFPTDLQPMVMASLCTAEGVGVIWERVFENRFIHVMEFNRLGANIRISSDRATIIGNKRVYHIDRGYQRLDERFNSLGAKIQRLSE
jgi:UDP-N-acetylglucosamine 1-carboxyvinyltransferase